MVGINYPWFHYGWDFGNPPLAWLGGQSLADWQAEKRAQIAADFLSFARLGISAVRWFVLADGLNYGMGAEAPQLTNEQWRFQPLPAGHDFYRQMVSDFEFVLRTCDELGLQLVPVLIDFHWCFPGAEIAGNPGLIKGGRADLLTDPIKRADFLDRVLEPLLQLSLRYPRTIYAWEPINEPEWATEQHSILPFRKQDASRTVTRAAMRAYIAACNERINRCQLPDGTAVFHTTIGFAHWQTLKKWQTDELGITLRQFHYYAQDGAGLPAYDLNMKASCFIGEFATAIERDWPELQEFGFTQSLEQRLRWVAEKGYQAAFLWSARAQDPATLWTKAEQREVAAYLETGDIETA